ncbi:MAG: porin [Burkholderiales bacterium]|nr:porin [Burkholderiales bacterium]MDE2627568.1 porin [Burkholderiales bacterium]
MKKSLLALAVLGAFAGAASAQSSVTMSGTIDLAGRYVKNDGQDRRVSMSNSGINSSQLVLSGKEDLGGGLYAGFVLNSQLVADSGNSGLGGKFWNRRSTVSLWGNFGEIRLGRDYTPTFWNNTINDPFGTVGVGDSSNVAQLLAPTFVRADNAIGYFLPSNIGGIYGQAMVAASESAALNPGRYVGGRIGFAAGPFDIAGAYADQRFDKLPGAPSQKTYNIGGSYNLGVAKLMGYYDRDSLSYVGVDKKEDRFSLGATVPVGQGLINVGYDRSKLTDNVAVSTNTISKFALGYIYNLSKRTAVYSQVARLSNGSGSVQIGGDTGGSPAGPGPIPGGKSTGFEFGLRHFF